MKVLAAFHRRGTPEPTRHGFIGRILFAMFIAWTASALAQTRPYIGYTYPAGGQQGTTFQIKLGGQGLDDVSDLLVTGSGVSARMVEYYRRINPQEMQLLNEQLKELKKATSAVASAAMPKPAAEELIAKIEKRTREYVQTPACASISTLVFAEVTIAPDAAPGARELRLATPRGISNPLVFHVGQFPEHSRKPMITATIQVLGKEASALRKRPTNEVEVRVNTPCTVNGQIASGEVNRYRFEAHKGQRLVITTLARQLIPFIADAVPGWFQPVLIVNDTNGKELAYADDYRFRPDPVLFFEVPKDGEYVFAITDAIYRGREDFVYRITIGETPFVTSLFPLGAKAGVHVTPTMKGWNLQDAVLTRPDKDAVSGIVSLVANRKEIISNPVPWALDSLKERFDKEPNNAAVNAQQVTLPLIINGHIDQPGDWDIFQFTGKSNDTIVVEVLARRLDSPLDSVIKLTDAAGKLLAFSDDREDLAAGENTHQADSWFMARLPTDGDFFVHIGDTAHQGGEEYGYRLRLSPLRPDFELRTTPSSIRIRTNATTAVTVFAQRRDGFTNSIKLALKNPPPGFSSAPIKIAAGQNSASLAIKGPPALTRGAVSLSIVGSAKIDEKEIIREAVPAEDRMQAFLWRHLVPARDLMAVTYDPNYEPPPKRIPSARPPTVAANAAATNAPTGTNTVLAAKLKFTKSQVARRLREIKLLFEEGVLTEEFYHQKIADCEALQ
ncbi:MAG TPA: hypothetical protein VK530_12050 [Candidatus Acidoferrum sp.]|nr:hypothetical protein [Candidatus Acidoferrum sp.]